MTTLLQLGGDTLVATNGTLLENHAPTGTGVASTLKWRRGVSPASGGADASSLVIFGSEIGGAASVVGGQKTVAVLDKGGVAWPADMSVSFYVHYFSNINNPGVTLRNQPNGANISMQFQGVNIITILANGSTVASLNGISPQVGSFNRFVFEVQGTNIRLYQNNVLISSVFNSAIAAAGPPGVIDGSLSGVSATTGMLMGGFAWSTFINPGTLGPAFLRAGDT